MTFPLWPHRLPSLLHARPGRMVAQRSTFKSANWNQRQP